LPHRVDGAVQMQASSAVTRQPDYEVLVLPHAAKRSR
jgi:hypothetical protein